MTKEEFAEKLKEITENLSDQGKVTSVLTELNTSFETVFNEKETIKATNEELTTKNQELKDYNIELFMKLTQQEKDKDNEKGKTSLNENGEGDDKQPTLKFEDLFDEKGEFK